ncbi:MAG: L-threonylcarbamoyladenylate synthase [Ignavibacteriales bacterium]
MQTVYLQVDGEKPDPEIIEVAAFLIRSGEVVAFPTETVYGLGANALDEEAVQKIFTAKGRRMDNPLIAHVCSWDQAAQLVCDIPDEVYRLIERFWPGPLTIVAHSRDNVPEAVRAGQPTAAVRMPDHPVALELIRRAGMPIAAPSANISGRPSPTKAEHVKHDLNGKIAAILDGGITGFGIESTIIDVTQRPFRIIRPGAISIEQLAEVIPIELIYAHTASDIQGRSAVPHYQTDVKVKAIPYGSSMQAELTADEWRGLKLGAVVVSKQEITARPAILVAINEGPHEYGRRLYEIFRLAEEKKLDVLIMEKPPEEGLGRAVADRIVQASQGKGDRP